MPQSCAHLILDHGDGLAVVTGEDVVDQGRFARAQEASDLRTERVSRPVLLAHMRAFVAVVHGLATPQHSPTQATRARRRWVRGLTMVTGVFFSSGTLSPIPLRSAHGFVGDSFLLLRFEGCKYLFFSAVHVQLYREGPILR